MIVLTFKPRFAPLVVSGQKRQTIRPIRKRPIKAGDELSLREWTGRPYASPQRILREKETCRSTEPFAIGYVTYPESEIAYAATLSKYVLTTHEREELAVADGFESWEEMFIWFAKTHKFPFFGTLIKW